MNKVTGLSLFFCLLFIFSEAQVLVRGPYLQMGTSTSMNIRWRTDVGSISRVRYGISAVALNNSVEDLAIKTEHELKIPGLSPNTQYWYSIEAFVAGADISEFNALDASGGKALATKGQRNVFDRFYCIF